MSSGLSRLTRGFQGIRTACGGLLKLRGICKDDYYAVSNFWYGYHCYDPVIDYVAYHSWVPIPPQEKELLRRCILQCRALP